MSNKSHHTIETILQRLNNDDRALERALVAIRENATLIQSRKVFSKSLFIMAARLGKIFNGRKLRVSEKAYARQKLAQVKYYGILRRCADQIMGEG